MSETKVKKERPLSPHLQIYKPQITSISSILHRMAGVFLTLGLFIFVWGLLALAGGRESYDAFMACASSPLGQIVLIAWSAAFFYHMSTGLRHFILDAGYLYEKGVASKSGFIVLGIAIVLTGALWGGIYGGFF